MAYGHVFLFTHTIIHQLYYLLAKVSQKPDGFPTYSCMGLLDGANCQLVTMIILILIYGMSYGIDMGALKVINMVYLALDQFVLINRLRWKSGYKLLIIRFGDESASELFITDICTCSRDGVDVLQIIIKFIYQHFVVKILFILLHHIHYHIIYLVKIMLEVVKLYIINYYLRYFKIYKILNKLREMGRMKKL
eukprot:973518_1